MLSRLRTDHQNLTKLLDILKVKTKKFIAGEYVDFLVIQDIVEYMQSYMEHCHHPIEDILYDNYRIKLGSDSFTKEVLLEHQEIVKASQTLNDLLSLVLQEILVSKSQVVTLLNNYVSLQEKHILYEEEQVFPLLEEAFNSDDWNKLIQLCNLKLIEDPLFNTVNSDLYPNLRRYLTT